MKRIEPHVTVTTGRSTGFQVSRIANETVLYDLYITGEKKHENQSIKSF